MAEKQSSVHQPAVEIELIVDELKNISKAKEARLYGVINQLEQEEQLKKQQLLMMLQKINKSLKSKKLSVKDEEKRATASRNKAAEVGCFLGKLQTKLWELERGSIRIKTKFHGVRSLLIAETMEEEEDKLVERFNELTGFIMDLNVLKTLAEWRQGAIINELKERNSQTTQEVAARLVIPVRWAEKLASGALLFYDYPALAYTGYSTCTLLQYKKAIIQLADAEENLKTIMTMGIEPEFEGEEDCKPK